MKRSLHLTGWHRTMKESPAKRVSSFRRGNASDRRAHGASLLELGIQVCKGPNVKRRRPTGADRISARTSASSTGPEQGRGDAFLCGSGRAIVDLACWTPVPITEDDLTGRDLELDLGRIGGGAGGASPGQHAHTNRRIAEYSCFPYWLLLIFNTMKTGNC
jgi:hypothetical protein